MTRPNILALVLWMTVALFAFSATAVAVRELSPSFSAFEILSFRNAAGVLMLLALALAKPSLRSQVRPRDLPLHVLRNAIHFGGTYGWTVGVMLLPLATVFALEFTMPAWTALLAVLVLRERMTGARLGAVVLGLLGVLIILRPGFGAAQTASLVVLAAAVCFAGTSIATKKLTGFQSTYTILLWMNLIQLPLNLSGTGASFWTKLQPSHALPVAAICLGGLLSHYGLTNAYRYGDASVVVPLDFLRIPLIALVGWQFYGEQLDVFVLLGSLTIIAGVLWNLRAEAARGAA
jgi:drug/metabolite transporter (DMT)-like permease